MRFRVLTYNIHKAIGVDRKFAPERIVEILRHHDADVVLLQEVDRFRPRSGLLDLASYLARQLDYRYRAVGMNVFFKHGKYGNATLSRYPIGRQHNIDLTIGRTKRRGAQHTRIHFATRERWVEVDVFNVHLSLAARLRRQQVERLLATHDVAHLVPEARCVIAGDMNDWPGVLKRRYFAPARFLCATNRRPGSRWAIKTFPSFAPSSGLDKIFYRGLLHLLHAHHSRLKLARVASDHLPVIADFEIQPEPRDREAPRRPANVASCPRFYACACVWRSTRPAQPKPV
ncbi:MAG TPA: endonuclease/exonuclease/phosphatase family protein [Phycisphaerae bacterium]|nr:endonuclease/exonuclease/phosphatase family protein [Phycisphaerae bacterium]